MTLVVGCDGDEGRVATPTPTTTAAADDPADTPSASPSPTPEEAPDATPSPSPASAVERPEPNDAERCRETPAADSEPDCIYEGPLFDAHFHPYDAIPRQPETPPTAMCDLLERDEVSWGLALYELPPDPADAEHRVRVIERSTACAVPLVQPMYASDAGSGRYAGFRRGDYSTEQLDAWLRPEGPLAGVGEIALYFEELHDVSMEHPIIETALAAVDERGGVAMIHPRVRGSHHAPVDTYPDPTTAEEIASAAARYPETTFVIHGGLPLWDELAPHFEDHPNLFFSYETAFWFMEAGIPFTRTSPVQFLQALETYGTDRLIETALEDLGPRLEAHPDRTMWGLDRYLDWHFEPEVSERWLEVTRLVIARLPEETQAAYAYENALRELGGHLQPPIE